MGRNTTSIDKDDEAEAALDGYCGARGALKKVVVSRLIKWFVSVPDSTKDVVMGWVPNDLRPAYAAALRAMADQLDSPADDNVSVLLSPENHQNVMTKTPKKRKTG